MFGSAHLHRVGPRVGPKDRRSPSRRTIVFFLAISITVISGIQSLALFTDTASSTQSLHTGTIVLSLEPTSTTIAMTAMAPSDGTTASFVVKNNGTLDLRYAITVSSTSGDGSGTNLAHALTAVLYGKSCASKTSGDALSSGTLDQIHLGSAASGQQTGDRVLAPSSSETLCLTVDLSSGVTNTYQDASTATTFTFQAEQTKNNP